METQYYLIITDKESYVTTTPKESDHIAGVFLDSRGACNTARKIANQFGLEYIPIKQGRK